MLSHLKVRNLAVVEETEVEFGPGLNVITGETGAGKSVLMGALELVLGGRAEAGQVRDGAREAEVEAVFDGRSLRRTVTAEGRSRAWVDDESVTLAELRELGHGLVDVHGPRANQRLLEPAFQREAVDAFGGIAVDGAHAAEAAAYGRAWAALSEASAQLAELEGASDDPDELDLLRFQVGELEEAGVTVDDDDLAERHAAAAHAAELVESANAVTEALGGDAGVESVLEGVRPRLAAMARHFPAAAEWAETVEDLTLRTQELSRTVADAISRLDADPEAFAEMDRRLTLVNRLRRKYVERRPAATDEGFSAAVAAILAEKRGRLEAMEHRGERLAELRSRRDAARAEVRAAGAKLTALRTAAGERLAKAVTRELRDLGFRQARFATVVSPAEPDAHGCDLVTFMFEPNPGESARPLAAIASSGEIARVMLAVKVVAAGCQRLTTMVFDEIDANVGGEIGAVVGRKLRTVAADHQVIAITHLPQSAVFGERHLVVAKTVSGGRTRTGIAAVSGEERVSEIARMLGGEKITSVVRKHAQELLELSD